MKRKKAFLSIVLSAMILLASCSGGEVNTVDTLPSAEQTEEIVTTTTVDTAPDSVTETEETTTVAETIVASETTVVETTAEEVTTEETTTTTVETTVVATTVSETVTSAEETTTVTTTKAETTVTTEKTTEKTKATTTTTEQTTTVTEEPTVENVEKKYIALTFDDGPNTTTTNEVLDVLEQYGIKASFFLIGNNINSNTESVVKRAYDMGCDIGNHSKSHPYMNEMTAEQVIEEVEYVNEYVEQITGEAPKFFRPPYIAVSNTMYEEIDMPFICGFGCNDWDDKVTVEKRYKYIIKQADDGGIILLHDAQGNSKTVEALHTIITELQAQGYEFVTLTELFEIKGVEISGDDLNLYSYVGRKF